MFFIFAIIHSQRTYFESAMETFKTVQKISV